MPAEKTIHEPLSTPLSKALVRKIKWVLVEMAFKDIQRASNGEAKIGAFILASCFIEYLAGFRYGKTTEPADYKSFVKAYFDTTFYNPNKLYSALRCRLVHNYSEGGAYIFTYNRPKLHGVRKDGKIILNLEQFVSDIETAMGEYFAELDKDVHLQELAEKRFRKLGLLNVATL